MKAGLGDRLKGNHESLIKKQKFCSIMYLVVVVKIEFYNVVSCKTQIKTDTIL